VTEPTTSIEGHRVRVDGVLSLSADKQGNYCNSGSLERRHCEFELGGWYYCRGILSATVHFVVNTKQGKTSRICLMARLRSDRLTG
jgi:hypothetical protein